MKLLESAAVPLGPLSPIRREPPDGGLRVRGRWRRSGGERRVRDRPGRLRGIVHALLARRRRTNHTVLLALCEGFTVLVLAERAGIRGTRHNSKPTRAARARTCRFSPSPRGPP
ncbi:DUF6086 family protein [Streptomyces sp. NPDC032161]|uniref:DUF6086 family protein n=1 Tax=unclassified Streptomyces TaxID=2593676 RepID=UPI0033D0490D